MNNSFDLNSVKQGLNSLVDAVEQLQQQPVSEYTPAQRSISGNAINGGMITNFRSVGIQDLASKLTATLDDDGIHIKAVHTEELVGDTTVSGDLRVDGLISAKKLHVDEITADIRQERSSPLEFIAGETESVYGKGLLWRGFERTAQFVYHTNPDRILSTEHIDLTGDAAFMLNSVPVLSGHTLGTSIIHSNLQRVGALESLAVQGNVMIDEFIVYNAGSQRLGLNTDEPNGTFSVAGLDHEFIIETEDYNSTKLGNYSASNLEIVTDNTSRITVTSTGDIKLGNQGTTHTKVSVYGKLGVNVTNVSDDVSFAVAGKMSQDGKQFIVGAEAPRTGTYNQGDIVWNTHPQPTGFVGWICIKEGTPGIWKPFGQISQ